MTRRTCNRCKDSLPLIPEFFHRDAQHSSGFQRQCKRCTRQRLDARKMPPVAVAPPDITPARVAEVCAEEIAQAVMTYALAHDVDLLDRLADVVAGRPLPDPADAGAYEAADEREFNEYPAAYFLRRCGDMAASPAQGA